MGNHTGSDPVFWGGVPPSLQGLDPFMILGHCLFRLSLSVFLSFCVSPCRRRLGVQQVLSDSLVVLLFILLWKLSHPKQSVLPRHVCCSLAKRHVDTPRSTELGHQVPWTHRTHTHTHTHSLCLSPLSHSSSPSLCLSVSLSHTHSISLSHTYPFTLPLSLSYTHTLSVSPFLSSFPFSLSPSLSVRPF